MSEGDDPRSGRHRSMTCGRQTAPAMARALVRSRLLRPGTVAVVLVIGLLGALPLASDGYLRGAAVQGIVSILFVGAVLVWATHRRTQRAARTLYPAGATVDVELADDAMRVRTAVGQGQVRYADVKAPLVVHGHVVLPMRRVRTYVTLPPGLLTAADVAWLRERIARAHAQEPVAVPAVAVSPLAEPDVVQPAAGPAGIGGEVVITEEMVEHASRALLRYRLLRGRVGLAVVLVSLGSWIWLGDAIGWLPGLAVVLIFAGALVLATALQTRRTLRRTTDVGRRLRTRFDDTHLHLDVDGAQASLAYSAVRSCVARGDVVVLAMKTGVLQVLPRELVPDEAVRRLQPAPS